MGIHDATRLIWFPHIIKIANANSNIIYYDYYLYGFDLQYAYITEDRWCHLENFFYLAAAT